MFLIETAQKNEEKGDAEYKKNEFSNAAVFYTKGIEEKCKDVALAAVLYKKRAASHFFQGEFRPLFDFQFSYSKWRRGGLMVSTLDSGSRSLGSSPGQAHCVVFLGKTLYSYSDSLYPGV